MDNGVVPDNLIDTSISHNTDSKLLDNEILSNNHATWNNSTKKDHSQINIGMLHHISIICNLSLQWVNYTINVEQTLVKDSSQVPQKKTLKTFHQYIRGLGNKFNELYCHLHNDLPHILCLSDTTWVNPNYSTNDSLNKLLIRGQLLWKNFS